LRNNVNKLKTPVSQTMLKPSPRLKYMFELFYLKATYISAIVLSWSCGQYDQRWL